jgi:hypothetical protein
MDVVRTHRLLLCAGSALASALLLKFAWDFSGGPVALTLPLWLLVITAAGALALNTAAAWKGGVIGRSGGRLVAALLLSIPLGFLASSLDCTGLAARGCAPFCTFVKAAWVPLVAAVALLYHLTGRGAILLALTAMLFVPLAPHCVCGNPANLWWIRNVGASPQCYLWGFAASLLAVTAQYEGAWLRLSLAACYAIVGGALSFFVGHHYLHFPW